MSAVKLAARAVALRRCRRPPAPLPCAQQPRRDPPQGAKPVTIWKQCPDL